MESKGDKITVEVDLQITRRRRVHEVANGYGVTLSHHQTIADLLQWLHANGHDKFKITAGDETYLIQMTVPPWQK